MWLTADTTLPCSADEVVSQRPLVSSSIVTAGLDARSSADREWRFDQSELSPVIVRISSEPRRHCAAQFLDACSPALDTLVGPDSLHTQWLVRPLDAAWSGVKLTNLLPCPDGGVTEVEFKGVFGSFRLEGTVSRQVVGGDRMSLPIVRVHLEGTAGTQSFRVPGEVLLTQAGGFKFEHSMGMLGAVRTVRFTAEGPGLYHLQDLRLAVRDERPRPLYPPNFWLGTPAEPANWGATTPYAEEWVTMIGQNDMCTVTQGFRPEHDRAPTRAVALASQHDCRADCGAGEKCSQWQYDAATKTCEQWDRISLTLVPAFPTLARCELFATLMLSSLRCSTTCLTVSPPPIIDVNSHTNSHAENNHP